MITAYVSQFAAMGPRTVHASSPRGYRQGNTGWFEDRALFPLHDGESVPVRFTGVVRRESDTWPAVQTHVSIGTPNALVEPAKPGAGVNVPARALPGRDAWEGAAAQIARRLHQELSNYIRNSRTWPPHDPPATPPPKCCSPVSRIAGHDPRRDCPKFCVRGMA